jgi:hypothetical protein
MYLAVVTPAGNLDGRVAQQAELVTRRDPRETTDGRPGLGLQMDASRRAWNDGVRERTLLSPPESGVNRVCAWRKGQGKKPRDVLRLTKPIGVRGLDLPPLETVEDVRVFLWRVPTKYRKLDIWQRLEVELDKAEASGNATDASIVLQFVLSMMSTLEEGSMSN